ncbi:MAG: diadenylate cyclase CdaA [Clostridia bacterium]|nr:diadenylate cyclase CdaA [Clostridia bacterium]
MFIETLETFFMQVKDVFLNIDWLSDIADILLVAVIAYGIIMQLRKSQSIQVIKGIIFIAVLYGLVNLLGMNTSKFIFTKLFSDIIIIFVVLFSTELRQALENVGKRKFGKNPFFSSSSSDESEVEAINAVCRACGAMSRSKVGALIVFQRDSLLGDLTKHAVSIDSETTFEMVCSIFYPKAPLHDGAIVIKDGRIVAARCVVPMKNDRVVTENIGTRHRAAIEVSLNSDAVAVVTSEETGLISLAVDGKLTRGFTDSELREKLGMLMLTDKNAKSKRFAKKNKKSKATEEIEVTSEEKVIDTSLSQETEIAEEVAIEAPFEDAVSEEDNKIVNEGAVNDEQE